jgi:hypothetical protein
MCYGVSSVLKAQMDRRVEIQDMWEKGRSRYLFTFESPIIDTRKTDMINTG